MIISASRRTDIPAYYADWFLHRLKEGSVFVRNPMNPHQVSKISLSPDLIDGIVFWSKNPAPLLGRLQELRDYPYYFQFTVNAYGSDIEKNVPSKRDAVIPTFQKLSAEIGKERVVWRYDPILLNEKYTLPYHVKYFRILADRLADYTEKCTVSFFDLYPGIRRNTEALGIFPPSRMQMDELMGRFSAIAAEYGIGIDTCAEEADFRQFGIGHAQCIDAQRLERIGGARLTAGKDTNQRAFCGCVASIDIGAYNTCHHGCVYCYANFSQPLLHSCHSRYDAQSPLLCGSISAADRITSRKMKSYKDGQISLFSSREE